jgi:hypothetical protein
MRSLAVLTYAQLQGWVSQAAAYLRLVSFEPNLVRVQFGDTQLRLKTW